VGDTVAVMGMAHVDGVERYLLSRGWEMRSYPCKVVR
jgi:pheromone shutdown protein TraB